MNSKSNPYNDKKAQTDTFDHEEHQKQLKQEDLRYYSSPPSIIQPVLVIPCCFQPYYPTFPVQYSPYAYPELEYCRLDDSYPSSAGQSSRSGMPPFEWSTPLTDDNTTTEEPSRELSAKEINDANVNGENIYISGLNSDCTDEALLNLVPQEFTVKSAKAIRHRVVVRDEETGTTGIPYQVIVGKYKLSYGACKGFGFIMFTSKEVALQAKECLTKEGYRASFAKPSYSYELRSLQDKESTSLYIANLPTTMTVEQLKDMISEANDGEYTHNVFLMKEKMPSFRKSGFVHFGSREAVEKVVSRLNGAILENEPLIVRYSDTPGQKKLKRDKQKQQKNKNE